MVSPNLPTPALPMRGVTRFEQSALFAEAGHDVRGVVPLPWSPRRWLGGSPVPKEEHDGSVVVAHPRYARVPRFLGSAGLGLERRLFARAAARALNRPDVVLAHSATLPGGLIGRVGGAVFVVSIYDHELYDWAPHSSIIGEAIARTLRGADYVVYLSEALRRSGHSLAGPHRSAVIPMTVEIYPGISAVRPERFTVCSVTRLIARKRVDHLIRAFARLAAEQPDAPPQLIIVGDGPERPALARLVQTLAIDGLVELTGALDARAARERMARAHVMALPSVRESLGVVYLEAMSLGVPALGTRGEGIDEHIEHGISGILVPPGDDEALLAELRALAADPERARRIGDAGRRRFLAGPFTGRDNARAYLTLFEDLLKGRATHTT
jgi:teichuronic acid biosynthesis glycosyltransferase TuaC